MIERRAVAEIRTSGRTLYGTACPFNRRAEIGGAFTETVMPGSFAACLASNADIVALADHRSDALLGRTRSGTLRLTETPTGLDYSLDLPATSLGNDLLILAQRGDLSGVSIGFVADTETWIDANTRQLRAVTLHEVSILGAAPAAYSGTSIALRSREIGPDLGTSPAIRRRLLDLLR